MVINPISGEKKINLLPLISRDYSTIIDIMGNMIIPDGMWFSIKSQRGKWTNHGGFPIGGRTLVPNFRTPPLLKPYEFHVNSI